MRKAARLLIDDWEQAVERGHAPEASAFVTDARPVPLVEGDDLAFAAEQAGYDPAGEMAAVRAGGPGAAGHRAGPARGPVRAAVTAGTGGLPPGTVPGSSAAHCGVLRLVRCARGSWSGRGRKRTRNPWTRAGMGNRVNVTLHYRDVHGAAVEAKAVEVRGAEPPLRPPLEAARLQLELDDRTLTVRRVRPVDRGPGGITAGYRQLDGEILAGLRLARLCDGGHYPRTVSRLIGYDADAAEPFALLETLRGPRWRRMRAPCRPISGAASRWGCCARCGC